jgi:hypothetical protein
MAGGRQSNVLNDFDPGRHREHRDHQGSRRGTLYGSEASAGVIQIITKRGANGAPTFPASVSEGRNFHPRTRTTRWGPCGRARPSPASPATSSARAGKPTTAPGCPGSVNGGGSLLLVPHDERRRSAPAGFNPEWDYAHCPQTNVLQYGRPAQLQPRHPGRYAKHPLLPLGQLRLQRGIGVLELGQGQPHERQRRRSSSPRASPSTSSTAHTREARPATPRRSRVRGGLWDQVAWGKGYCTPYVAAKWDTSLLATPGHAAVPPQRHPQGVVDPRLRPVHG